MVESVLYVDKG